MIKESSYQENKIIINICTSKQSLKVYETKANKSKVKINNSRKIVEQIPHFQEWIDHLKNQKGNKRLKPQYIY